MQIMFRFVVVLACILAVATAFVSQSGMARQTSLAYSPFKKSAPAPAPAPAAPAKPAAKSSSFNPFGKKAAPAPAPTPAKKAAAPVKKAAAPAKKAAAPAASSSKKSKFVPSSSFAYGLVGADEEAGDFDPLGFSTQVDQATVEWYRAAELKHGRVCMLAALGLLFAPTNAQVHWLPDDVFSAQGGIAELNKLSAERPEAILQILTAISAVEVLSLFRGENGAPGDLGWDPLNFKEKFAADQDALQLRELKNGRLAMLGTSALLLQESISGLGPWEQLAQK